MSRLEVDTGPLLARAGNGDPAAVGELLDRHRARLRRMVSVRMDPRLTARFDPSDVVQEALAEAAQRLPEYSRNPVLPFYPWLRQIAWQRLVNLYDRHVRAQKRSVNREERLGMDLSDESRMQLAERLLASHSSPSRQAVRSEVRARMRAALDTMLPHDREILVMWHLEELSISEMAALLGLTEAGVKSRHRRALERLLRILEERGGEP